LTGRFIGSSLGTAVQPFSSPLDFPSRSHRVKGALRASLTRSAFADPGHGTRSTGTGSYEEDGGRLGGRQPNDDTTSEVRVASKIAVPLACH
jgi:hypothetical protein